MAAKFTPEEAEQQGEKAENNPSKIKISEEELDYSKAQLKSIFMVAPIGIGIVSNRVLTWVNERLCKMLGYFSDNLIGKSARILYPDDAEFERVGRVKYRQIQELGTGSVETRWKRQDGAVIDVLLSSTPLLYDDWSKGVTFTALDITARKQMEKELRQSEEKYRQLVQNLPSIVYRGYKDWSAEFFDKKIELFTGYDVDEFNSKRMKWSDIIFEEDIHTAQESFIRALKTDRSYVREYRIRSKTGDTHWIQERSQIACDEKGEIDYISGVFFDITDWKYAEEELKKAHEKLEEANKKLQELATSDGLTGLANRRKFDESLVHTWHQCLRDQKPISIIIIDVDHFKIYNDEYGHQAGDDCLKRLSDILREGRFTRRPGDLIARYGGEEFVVILNGTPEKYAVKIGESICRTIKDMKIPHEGTQVVGIDVVTVSLGVASEIPEMGSTPQEFFEKADKALYRAKKGGRNRVEIFQG